MRPACHRQFLDVRTPAAIAFGAIIAAAITASIFRCKSYPSFGAWWDAEGLPIWGIAGMLAGGLYFAS
jgi:hypothetical protein